jgi:fatty-acid peroxygenase
MPEIPRDTSLDSTLAFLSGPYRFISLRCSRYGSDLFQTQLLLQRTICMSGPEAAELFYDEGRFVRSGAMPQRVQKTLFGIGGVQGLDGEAHRHRKQMFMSLMTPERIKRLAENNAKAWHAFARKWQVSEQIVLYDEVQELLTRTVCGWAGVPLREQDVAVRTRQIAALFDYAGRVGPKHWYSRYARKRAEHWMAGIVERIRSGALRPPPESAAHVISWFHDFDGELLTPHEAAVELLNVIRPTVAVAVYITFVAHALHQYPEKAENLTHDSDSYSDFFVQEVRRFYPFFPAVAARVRKNFEWKDYHFPAGIRAVLDLYGTNHDRRTWNDPDEFRPERFRNWDGNPFNFIPQGGGDHYLHHRCAGEWITISLMKVALSFLTAGMSYDVPPQDLRIDYSRLPALPRSHFIIGNVKTKEKSPDNPSLQTAHP